MTGATQYTIYYESGYMELELYVAHFFKSKMIFKSFQKIRTKNIEIENYEIYYCAKKSILNSLYFGLSKNNKLAKISNFQTIH
jgi:hypothetical protein